MIQVLPMPGELAEGHLARIRLINGISSRAGAICALRVGADSMNDSVLGLLATHSGMGCPAYAAAHSMLPILRVSSRKAGQALHGSIESASYTRRLGMLTPRREAQACEACISDDLDRHGFSWFRREHQLVGIDWCIHHGISLLEIRTNAPFASLPHTYKNNCDTMAHRQRTPIPSASGSFLGRYATVMASFMTLTEPISSTKFHRALSSTARAAGLRTSEKGMKPLASDLIKEQAPEEWLLEHFYPLATKPSRKPYRRIDSLLMPATLPGTGDSYALLVTALVPSPKDRWETILEFAGKPEVTSDRTRHVMGQEFWEGGAYILYVQCYGNLKKMSQSLKMDRSYFASKMVGLGMPSLVRAETSPCLRAFADFYQGSNITDACAKHDISVVELEAFLRRCSARVGKALCKIEAN